MLSGYYVAADTVFDTFPLVTRLATGFLSVLFPRASYFSVTINHFLNPRNTHTWPGYLFSLVCLGHHRQTHVLQSHFVVSAKFCLWTNWARSYKHGPSYVWPHCDWSQIILYIITVLTRKQRCGLNDIISCLVYLYILVLNSLRLNLFLYMYISGHWTHT